jgi:sugar phosphate isomerase/epimerase
MYGLGIRVPGVQLDRNPGTFIADLNTVRDIGFDSIEICPEDFDAIGCGRLETKSVEMLVNILSAFEFKISVHVPQALNLFNRDQPEIHLEVLKSCFEFTKTVGGSILVYHPGRYVDNTEFGRFGKETLSHSEKTLLKRKEAEVLQDLAGRFPGITVAMENQRPYVFHSPFCYAEMPDELSAQVKCINRKNVGIMIDTGHLYLSARYFGYDLIDVIRNADIKPVHFHINDNHGFATYHTEKNKKSQHPFGRGDEHIVPGTGDFPFKEFLGMFPGFEGNYVIELTDRLFYPAKIRESYFNLKSFLN